jgi:peptide/nickel transport system ATP-binding protein
MSTILITHDLGLAAAYCDRVVVMEKGRVVETALSPISSPARTRLYQEADARDAAARRLLARFAAGGGGARLLPVACRRCIHRPPDPLRMAKGDGGSSPGVTHAKKPLLLVEKLVKEYPRQGATRRCQTVRAQAAGRAEQFRAVDGISFTVGHGESVGLVGESGCGKSTTSMMVMRLLDQTSGRIMFDGDEIGGILPNAFARLPLRKSIQMVFQDPTDSLNPRFTAARAIADPIMQLGDIRGRDALRARCEELAGWSACRSICSIASRINCRAARRPASASRARSRCIRSS